jgi:hypothetical protein
MPWFVILLITVALDAISFLLRPAPPAPPQAAAEQAPTASAGRLTPVVFGEVIVDDTNVLWTGDLSSVTYQVSA